MIVSAVSDPASEAGEVELTDVGSLAMAALQNMDRCYSSWVMLTAGRFPQEVPLTRPLVAQASVAAGLLRSRDIDGRDVTLKLGPLSDYLSTADGRIDGAIIPNLYGPPGTTVDLSDAMDLIVRTDGFTPVRKGLALREYGSEPIILSGEYSSRLDFARWIAAQAGSSWRVRLASAGGWVPTLDIAPLGTLWGEEIQTNIILSPVLPTSQPQSGGWFGAPELANQPRVVRATVQRSSDASNIVSTVWGVNNSQHKNMWAGGYAQENRALTVLHPNGLGLLSRHKIVQSEMDIQSWTPEPQLQNLARKVMNDEHVANHSWTVSAAGADDVLALPLGAPVAVYDPEAGVIDTLNPTVSRYYNGPEGASPRYGFRVMRKEWPFMKGMGVYVALSGPDDGWRVIDLSDYVVPSAGSATIAYNVTTRSLRPAITGLERV